MGQETKIAWCDHTQNFWYGCTKVSAACDNCYAEALMDHRMGMVEWGNHPRKRTSPSNWRQPYRWDRAAREAGERRRVFTLSLGDFFDNQVPEEWRHEAWGVIGDCRNLDWLILTKRPQNIAKMLLPSSVETSYRRGRWPWPHVWLGTTVENQDEADRRIPALLSVPAAVHFLSMEPLLEPVDLTMLHHDGVTNINALTGRHGVGMPHWPGPHVDWVILGGESGGQARPFHVEYAQDIVRQCQAHGVPVFMKQLGSRPAHAGRVFPVAGKGGDMAEWPQDLRIREFPA